MSTLTLDYNEKEYSSSIVLHYENRDVATVPESVYWMGYGTTLAEALTSLTADLVRHPMSKLERVWLKESLPADALTSEQITILEQVQL